MPSRRAALFIFVGIALVVAALLSPEVRSRMTLLFIKTPQAPDSDSASDDHHQHDDEVKFVVLSDSGKGSLGLSLKPVVLQDYWKCLPVPAEVMEEPGHCEQGVSATVHGIILKIHAFHGQTVRTGDPLFDIRPTSELLATAQSSLLKSIQEIEFVRAELERLGPVGELKGIPAVRVIEKQNELKRLESQRLLQMQELLVRGLTSEQIAGIVRTKTLIQEITIRVPDGGKPHSETDADSHGSETESALSAQHDTTPSTSNSTAALHEHGSVYSIEQLNVHLGKVIQAGDELCHLARHSELLIAGRAFESESFLVTRAIEKNWPVKAVFEVTDESPVVREGLSILYSDNVVEADSRTIRFYLPLSNELVRDRAASNGLAYRSWRFKPGQRARVLLPVEHLASQIVLPADAVVKHGAEAFVFRANGRRLERVEVRLLYMDSRDAVIKSDGKIIAGDVVAMNQAFQLDMALKNSEEKHGDHHGHDHEGHQH